MGERRRRGGESREPEQAPEVQEAEAPVVEQGEELPVVEHIDFTTLRRDAATIARMARGLVHAAELVMLAEGAQANMERWVSLASDAELRAATADEHASQVEAGAEARRGEIIAEAQEQARQDAQRAAQQAHSAIQAETDRLRGEADEAQTRRDNLLSELEAQQSTRAALMREITQLTAQRNAVREQLGTLASVAERE